MITKIPATDNDKEFAKMIHHLAYKGVVLRQFGQRDDLIQDNYFYKGWSEAIFEIVKYNERPIGYYGHRASNGEFHIMEIVLHPEYQGRGIGSWILKSEIEAAINIYKVIKLQVLCENVAKRLYSRLGFVEYGKSQTHIFMEYKQPAQQVDAPEPATTVRPALPGFSGPARLSLSLGRPHKE